MLDFVRSWLFPPACVACDARGAALCAACAPRPSDATAFALDGVPAFALGRYEGALRSAIVAMKRGERDSLDAFGDLLAGRAPPIAGAIVPLATARGRVLERGFDQSVELARRLAVRRGAACAYVLEKRGAAQEGLGRRRRLAAANRFRVRPGAALPPVATLLDDVCTTGATARDAVRALRTAGIDVRRVLFIARTDR